jgi:hypothetical protein
MMAVLGNIIFLLYCPLIFFLLIPKGNYMLENYYLKPQTIDHIRANWLAEPIERYVTWLHDQGYAARNVFHRVPLLLHFGSYSDCQKDFPK